MIVKGYASTPSLDWVRDIVLPGAFDESLRRTGIAGPKGVKLLWQHRSDKPLGRILKLEQRPRGLWLSGEIDEAISWGKDVAAAIKSNGGFSFSIGYRVEDADIGDGPDGKPALFLKRLSLHEVSVVTIPANEDAVMVGFGDPDDDPVLTALQDLTATLRQFNQEATR